MSLTFSGLYAGLTLKLLQSVLTAAFMFVAQRRIYELVKYVSKCTVTYHPKLTTYLQLMNLSVRKRKAIARLG